MFWGSGYFMHQQVVGDPWSLARPGKQAGLPECVENGHARYSVAHLGPGGGISDFTGSRETTWAGRSGLCWERTGGGPRGGVA